MDQSRPLSVPLTACCITNKRRTSDDWPTVSQPGKQEKLCSVIMAWVRTRMHICNRSRRRPASAR